MSVCPRLRDFDASLYLCEEAFGLLPFDTLERLAGTLLLYPYILTLLVLSGTLAVAALHNLRYSWRALWGGVYNYFWNSFLEFCFTLKCVQYNWKWKNADSFSCFGIHSCTTLLAGLRTNNPTRYSFLVLQFNLLGMYSASSITPKSLQNCPIMLINAIYINIAICPTYASWHTAVSMCCVPVLYISNINPWGTQDFLIHNRTMSWRLKTLSER